MDDKSRAENGVTKHAIHGEDGFTWKYSRGGAFGLDGSLEPAELAQPPPPETPPGGETTQVSRRVLSSSAQRLLIAARTHLVPANVAELLAGADKAAREGDSEHISGSHMRAGLRQIGANSRSAGGALPKDIPAGYPTGSLPAGNGKDGRRPRWLEKIRARLTRSGA